MFTAALLTTARTRKQPTCPSAEEWVKRWYIHTNEYYSAIKKNAIMPFAATWMGLESVTLSEVSYREEEISNDIPDMWTVKRNKQMNLVTTQKETHRLQK